MRGDKTCFWLLFCHEKLRIVFSNRENRSQRFSLKITSPFPQNFHIFSFVQKKEILDKRFMERSDVCVS